MSIVALDYGGRRTGVAVLTEGIVLPMEPVMGGWREIINRLEEYRKERGDLTVVLGLPVSALGKTTAMTLEVEGFAGKLAEMGYDVRTVDERGTSMSAAALTGGKDRRGRSDSVAACEILKRYLNTA